MAIDWAEIEEAMNRVYRGQRAWGQCGSLEGQRKLTQTPPKSAFTTPLTPRNAPPMLDSLALPIEGEGCEIVVQGVEGEVGVVLGRRKNLWGPWSWLSQDRYIAYTTTVQGPYVYFTADNGGR